MSDTGSVIEDTLARALGERADMLEAACERMLTDPRGWGVLEHDYGLRWTVELSPDVPLYEVHTHKASECRPCVGCENRHSIAANACGTND